MKVLTLDYIPPFMFFKYFYTNKIKRTPIRVFAHMHNKIAHITHSNRRLSE